jgi:NAD(P)-dependent dehydrogenase (short-subunit alcohol dehydrogenase family)
MTNKVWFITGASRGFGRIWAEAALERGDRVAATARNLADVADLSQKYGELVLPLALDVTSAVRAREVVEKAFAHFGRLDVVVNNAGYPLVGAIEEANETEVRDQFDTNFFGTLRVIQAALPLLRKQGSGHIVGVSSGVGLVALPLIGFYCASKFAFEALHESLAQEVKSFGIEVTLLEPAAYATAFGSPSSGKMAAALDVYSGLREQVFGNMSKAERGDPRATARAILEIVDAENPPLRLMLGSTFLPVVRSVYADRLASWDRWESVSKSAQGEAK